MAKLSREQAIKLIKEPRQSPELQKARLKKVRNSLHTEPDVDDLSNFNEKHSQFLSWVKRILNNDEVYNRFLAFYRPPVPTNELTESIFSHFERIFNAQDSFELFEFDNSETSLDAQDYRNKLGDNTFWETIGFETFKNCIDDVLIVDLPELKKDETGELIQESDAPEPYYYILDVANIIDIENVRVKGVDDNNEPAYFFKTEYIIFRDDKDEVCVFDDEYYRRFTYVPGKEPNLISETPHDLGYCPARSFWTTPLNSKTKLLKRNVITNSLSELDWLLFFEISAKYLKIYAPFPIYAVYKSTCTYKDPGNKKIKCNDGYLTSVSGEITRQACPKCSNKIKNGPGNILEVRAPQDRDDPDLLANPVKIIPAEEISVRVVNEELVSKALSIYQACVGKGQDPENKQAQNELQVMSGTESKESVIMRVKRNFEIAQNFALDTVFRLRYGEKFKSVTINYGSKFFYKEESEELEQYKTAKEQGLPGYDLALRKTKIDEARYRDNPEMLERIKIYRNLDPLPDYSTSEVINLMKTPGLLEESDAILKIHFNRFIERFEREQASVINFGSMINFDKKIAIITDILKGYVKEYKPEKPDPIPAPGPPAA